MFEAPFLPGILLKSDVTFFSLILQFLLALFQNKFKDEPVVLITAEHLRTGKEYDAALIWTEDLNKDSFKVCLRELQNFDGKYEDISVVCTLQQGYAKRDYVFIQLQLLKNAENAVTLSLKTSNADPSPHSKVCFGAVSM